MKLPFSVLLYLAIASIISGLVIPSLDKRASIQADRELNARDIGSSSPGGISAPVFSAASSSSAIPNKYIVVFKENTKFESVLAQKKTIQEKQKPHISKLMTAVQKANSNIYTKISSQVSNAMQNGGISFDFNVSDKLMGYTGFFLEETIESLKNDTNVAFIEQDAVVSTTAKAVQGNATWGISRLSSRTSLEGKSYGTYLYDSDGGDGVTAYIIDTGVYVDHADFEGRASWGATFTSDGDIDGDGHGTHVAGTIGSKTYGVAKKANLVAVKVLDNDGSGTNSGIISGIQYVAKQHSNNAYNSGYKGSTANLSLGGMLSRAVNNATNIAVGLGVHFAVAAGNNNDDACGYSPASASKVITVGATDNNDTRAEFSNYGSCVDIFAPGLDILSTYKNSTTSTDVLSGTSMASPHIAGLLTYFLSLQPGSNSSYTSIYPVTPEQLKRAVISFGTKNVISDVGSNSPNVLAYNGAGEDLTELWQAAASNS